MVPCAQHHCRNHMPWPEHCQYLPETQEGRLFHFCAPLDQGSVSVIAPSVGCVDFFIKHNSELFDSPRVKLSEVCHLEHRRTITLFNRFLYKCHKFSQNYGIIKINRTQIFKSDLVCSPRSIV